MTIRLLTALVICVSAASAGNLLLDGSFESEQIGYFNALGQIGTGPWTNDTGTRDAILGVFDSTTGYTPADPLTVGGGDAGGEHFLQFFGFFGMLDQNGPVMLGGHQYELSFDATRLSFGDTTAVPGLVFEADINGFELPIDLSSLSVPTSSSDASGWQHFAMTFTLPDVSVNAIFAFQSDFSTITNF